MDFKELRYSVTIATICVALIIAICIPAAYALDAIGRLRDNLDTIARIASSPAMTPTHNGESALTSLSPGIANLEQSAGVQIEVLDASGAPYSGAKKLVAWPALHVTQEIVRDGSIIGFVRTSDSLRPLLLRSFAAFMLCLMLALVVDAVMRSLSLRAVRDALARLSAANDSLTETNAKLREQAERLREAHEIGQIAYWTYIPERGEYWWSPEMYKLLGQPEGALDLNPGSVRGLGVGDAEAKAHAAHRRAYQSGSVETVDLKLTRGDGTVGCFSLMCKPLVDDQGRRIGLQGTLQDITARAHAEARLQQLAHYDPLTGLPNRGAVQGALQSAILETEETAGLSALMLIDLDNFKDVNDTMGHAAGDALLIEVVSRIRNVLSADDFFARLGGDEFAVLLKNVTTEHAIKGAALRILAAVSGEIELEAGAAVVGTSIGIAIVGRDGRTPDDLMRNADLALYRSKFKGRAMVSFFEPALDEEAKTRASLVRDLRLSLAEGRDLVLHYQPQVDLSTGRIVGFEALLRWMHPQRGLLLPSEFIPVAETSSLICELGSWVLRTAARQATAWHLEGGPPREVAVNVSPAQLSHSDLLAELDAVLAETGLPPHLLCLELTESLMSNPDDQGVRAVLAGLKARGVSLALDDFGTGYSSLGHLSELPFDKLKIDRKFVSGLTTSRQARELLKGIVTLGRGLRMKVHVEGTETLEELRTVCDFAADCVQGFAIAHPLPAEAAIAFARAGDGNDIFEDMLDLLGDNVRSAA